MMELHETTEARVIGLYSDQFDHLQGQDNSSMIEHWTLKQRLSKKD
jgi:hypothetical protein